MFTTARQRDPLFSDTLDIEEPETKRKIWYHWFIIRIRQYMILEISFFICLIMILYRLQTISNQNDRVLEIVSSMERKLAARESNEDISQSENTKPSEQSLKKMKSPVQKSTEKLKPSVSKMKQSTSQTEENTVNVPTPKERFRFNAANYLLGASVATHLSSRSSLYTNAGSDQSNLVILDRPQPPADKAWCTEDKNPVITINLAQYIKPISVSYQHTRWNVYIPSEAPKIYDVVACLDFYCKEWEPLASNCQYSQHEPNGAEQTCDISPDLDVPLIGKVQFRFRENYGDPNMTCVNLVRVYGETKTPIKIEKPWNSEKTCADLKWYYHNMYIGYYWTDKNCSVLYGNNCCSECPECCQECLITDYNRHTFFSNSMFLLVIIAPVLLMCLSYCLSRRRLGRNIISATLFS
ncbi:hypothetical protein B9Z55_015313 [Caenorhabditis nigoni]|uniref:SUN domain-containing protein n=1 Tax=Caenorhabditis nigoni TaxID=1611254 RepID=A0A2G5U9M9_9PELO|nr:hypothetical protein B9Z55_015313 [Caenorhabditis nigoni]